MVSKVIVVILAQARIHLWKIFGVTIGFLMLTGLAFESNAWETNASVSVAEIYTDNRCLSSSDKEDDWITSVTPRVGISGESARAQLNLDAALEVNSQDNQRGDCPSAGFGSSGSRDSVNPRLSADGQLELIRQMLFVEASGNIRQNAVDPFFASGDSNLNGLGNRNTTYSYSISPYFVTRIMDIARLTIRTGYDDQSNSAGVVEDSAKESASASLQSIWDSRLSWGLNYNYTRVDYQETELQPGEDNELASASVTLGYQLSRTFQINATGGEDFNEFSAVRQDTEGRYWDAGFNWALSPRTSIEAGVGDRFFGSSNRLSIETRSRRSKFSLAYDKSLTSDRELRTRDVFLPLVDSQGNILTISGQPIFIVTQATTLTRSPILEERLQASFSLEGRRTSLGLSASISDQTRLEDNLDSSFHSYAITVDRRLAKNLSANARVVYDERQADEGSFLGDDSETWTYYLGLSRGLGANTKLAVNYTFTDRSSDGFRDEYEENRFIVTLTMDLK